MHYYDTQGLPAYEITGKNGKKRTPYVKEAKELGYVPGVTSINGQLDKPQLTAWLIDMAIGMCADDPFCSMGANRTEWVKKIKQRMAIERDRVSGQGHAIHGALDKYYKTGSISDQHKEFICPVISLIENTWPNLTRKDWIAEKSFNYKGAFGGSVDLHTEGEGGIILDFKTKDTVDKAKFKAYDDHKQQLIAYAYGLKMPDAKVGNIFLSALTPNIIVFEMHEDREELTNAWFKFQILCAYWHYKNYKWDIKSIIEFKENAYKLVYDDAWYLPEKSKEIL